MKFISFMLLVFIVIFNPIYIDEVNYGMIIGRYLQDDFSRLFGLPQCPATFIVNVPFIWIPFSFLLSLVYFCIHNPLILRICALCAIFPCLLMTLRYVIRTKLELTYRHCYLILCSTLGVFPFFLVYARPEGLILVLILCLVCVAYLRSDNSRIGSVKIDWGYAVLAFFLVVGLFCIHPISFCLLPLIVFSIWHIFLKKTFTKIAMLILCLLCAWQSYYVHKAMYACPEDPAIDQFFNSYTNGNTDNINISFSRMLNIASNIFSYFGKILESISFYDKASFGMVPPLDVSPSLLLGLNAFLAIQFSVVLVVGFYSCYYYIFRVEQERDIGFVLALGASICLLFGAQSMVLPYRVTLSYPLLILLFAFCINREFLEHSPACFNFLTRFCKPLAVINALVFIGLFSAPVFASLTELHPVDQPLSSGIFAFNKYEDQINQALIECGIENSSVNSKVVCDQITYFSIMKTKTPVLLHNLMWGHQRTTEFMFERLRSMESSGVIVPCKSLPEGSEQYFKRVGEMCCAPSFR